MYRLGLARYSRAIILSYPLGASCTIHLPDERAGRTGVVIGVGPVFLVRLDGADKGPNVIAVQAGALSIDDYPDLRTGEIRRAGEAGL